MNLAKTLRLQWMQHLQNGRAKKVKDTTNFQRQEQSIQLKNLLNIGQNYAKNILSFLLKTVLMKKIGKDGRNLQTDLVTRFS